MGDSQAMLGQCSDEARVMLGGCSEDARAILGQCSGECIKRSDRELTHECLKLSNGNY